MSRRRNKKTKDDTKGYILGFISLLVVGTIGYSFYQESSNRVEIDELTNCPINGSPSRTAILIDTTDSLSRDQSLYLERRLDEIVKKSETFARFDVYFLDQKIEAISPKLSVCNPGEGDDKSELTSNVRRIKEKWQNDFYTKISSLFSELENVPTSDSSPIVEGIKYVSIDAFVGDQSQKKSLMIISDLLQHSSLLSHYNNGYTETASSDSSAINSSLPYLTGVNVNIMYIVRPSNRSLQTNKHLVFWENLIQESGGRVSSIEMVK